MKFVSYLSGILLLGLIAFAGGMWAHEKNWAPWVMVEEARQMLRSVRQTGKVLPERSYARRVQSDAVTFEVLDPDRASPGYLLVNRFDADRVGYVADLLDETGAVLHTWPIDYSKLVEGGHPGEFVHVAKPLPDGSLLVNFDDGTALARLDSCGDPIWTRNDYTFHHSIEADERGGFWTWAGAGWDGALQQYLIRFDAETGETLEQIGLLENVLPQVQSKLRLTLPGGFEPDRHGHDPNGTDFWHPNDIEPLTGSMAGAFPLFEPGDLLVSFRNIHMVGVIDRDTHALKWATYGPWRDQHDPDFTGDGTITVFSNNQYRFQSSILSVDPASGRVADMLAQSAAKFDSYIMGKLQHLDAGGLLVVSSTEGRVLEFAPNGDLVRVYNNILDEVHNGVVPYAEMILPNFFDSLPACGR